MIRYVLTTAILASALAIGTECALAGDRGDDAGLSRTRLAYACDGRHLCRQMRSCEEAYYFLRTCGVSRLDGDHDGIPCESLCGSR